MVKNSDLMKGKRGGDSRRRQQPLDCVGHRARCLFSDLSRGVTGEVHHVDSGYHVVGMKRPDAPDISLVSSS
jgi:enoyl-[acyl-carrier protein] reductase I